MGWLTWSCQLLCLQLLLLYSQSCAKLCSHEQSSALLQFKKLFSFQKNSSPNCDGFQQSYPKMKYWKEENDCCSWDGVTCDRTTGKVIGLDLSCSWLYGNIPFNNSLFFFAHLRNLNLAYNNFNYSHISPAFSHFPSLKLLNLTFCNFGGSIPASLGNLTQLTHLDLSFNNFTDHIPMSLSSLKQLRYLNLWRNNLIGQIPASLGNLTQLTHLDISCNYFSTDHVPTALSSLKQLRYLNLRWNNLIGKIPDIFANQTQLSYLDFSSNRLTCQIPASLGNLTQLTDLDLAKNNFSTYHVLTSLSSLKQLRYLNLFENNLIGKIPDIFANLTQLSYLDLSYNFLHGIIPSSLFTLPSMEYIDLSSNNLSGKVELYMFTKFKNLEYLDLSHNNLSLNTTLKVNSSFSKIHRLGLSSCNINEFPKIFRPLHQLQELDLSDNKIHGRIPNWMRKAGKDTLQILLLSHNFLTSIEHIPWKNLNYLDLRFNRLQGSLMVLPPSMNSFFISNNKLTGEIPSSYGSLSSIVYLDLSNNSLSGMIPENIASSHVLSVLDLRLNNFHGSIPQNFSNGCYLRILNLNGNQLEGPLPPSLVNCSYLQLLDVGNNKINDTFPHWSTTLSELQVLILRSNRFHGPIDNCKERFPFSKLRVLDLSHNEFSGVLPTICFKNFEAMMHGGYDSVKVNEVSANEYYSAFLTLKGNDVEMVKILIIFTFIDLSSNQFQGGIPEVVGKLNSLIQLNISHNSLTGPIPPSLGNLKALESLDLSSNKLVGEIPLQLTSLNFLEVLNLSYNQLVGAIPRQTHFDTLPNDSYVGNSGLCGFPLSKACVTNETPESSSTAEDYSESENGFSWKSVLTGYGCGMVLGMIMAYVAISTGKPRLLAKIAEGVYGRKVGRQSYKRRNGRNF